jgi:hypothetical protein
MFNLMLKRPANMHPVGKCGWGRAVDKFGKNFYWFGHDGVKVG